MAREFIKGICHFGLSVSDLAGSIRFLDPDGYTLEYMFHQPENQP